MQAALSIVEAKARAAFKRRSAAHETPAGGNALVRMFVDGAPGTAQPAETAADTPPGFSWMAVERRGALSPGSLVRDSDVRVLKIGVGYVLSGIEAVGPDSVLVRCLPSSDQDSLTSADARVLTIFNDAGERRRRPWRDVVRLLNVVECKELPFPGPRTTEWCCKFINQRQGGALDWHRFWRSVHQLMKADRVLVRCLPSADQDSLTSADVRVLIIFNDSGDRLCRPWRYVVQLINVVECAEWPIPGPRFAANAMAHHQLDEWVQTHAELYEDTWCECLVRATGSYLALPAIVC